MSAVAEEPARPAQNQGRKQPPPLRGGAAGSPAEERLRRERSLRPLLESAPATGGGNGCRSPADGLLAGGAGVALVRSRGRVCGSPARAPPSWSPASRPPRAGSAPRARSAPGAAAAAQSPADTWPDLGTCEAGVARADGKRGREPAGTAGPWPLVLPPRDAPPLGGSCCRVAGRADASGASARPGPGQRRRRAVPRCPAAGAPL